MPRMLFHRDIVEYTGGHGKVRDYFRHALALGWDARVYLTPRSLRDARNPWMAWPQRIEPAWRPGDCDLLFLAGMDWAALDDFRQPPRPVVNLLQHVRHGWPGHSLREFLAAPAHRICVSAAVAESVSASGWINGPLAVIPAALDVPEDLAGHGEDGGTVLVAGLKAPALAHELGRELRARGIAVEVLDGWMPRADYLARMARAHIAVALPDPQEGFYLPALEAMALGVPVVSGDCLGSREYARDGENCLLVALQAPALADAVQRAMRPELAAHLRREGMATAATFTQDAECAGFARVLHEATGGVC